MRVIGVRVREQNRVDAIDSRGDELQSQLGRRVDENSSTRVAFNHGADAAALVAGIWRPADLAVAAELRNAEARAGAEEGELHRRSAVRRAPRAGVIPFRP